MMEELGEEYFQLKCRKRKRTPSEWQREERKRSIIAGESHYTVSGQLVTRKEIGADCKCRLKCYQRVDGNLRQLLFKKFYSLKSYDEQNAYLFGLIRKYDVKRKKSIESDRRTCTFKYYVRNRGEEIQVCKLAFAHIHAVSFRKIRTLNGKLDQDIILPTDGRGKHDNRPSKTPPEIVNLIKNHIFQIIESDELTTFFKEDKNHLVHRKMNVAKMYLNFLQLYEPAAIDILTGQKTSDFSPKVKCWLYRKVFNGEIKSNHGAQEKLINCHSEKIHKTSQKTKKEISCVTFI